MRQTATSIVSANRSNRLWRVVVPLKHYGTSLAREDYRLRYTFRLKEATMDMQIWLPALFVTGLLTMAVLFAFIAGCDRV
jgi:hypothetical protein